MTDILGVPVSVGDRVAYTTGNQSNQSLEIGTIDSIVKGKCLIKTARGRITANYRSKSDIMSLAPAISVHPELFI